MVIPISKTTDIYKIWTVSVILQEEAEISSWPWEPNSFTGNAAKHSQPIREQQLNREKIRADSTLQKNAKLRGKHRKTVEKSGSYEISELQKLELPSKTKVLLYRRTPGSKIWIDLKRHKRDKKRKRQTLGRI